MVLSPFALALAGCSPVSALTAPTGPPGWTPGIFDLINPLYIKQELLSFITGSVNLWYGFIGQLYEIMLNMILYTPAEILGNSHIHKLWWIFVGIATTLLGAVTVIEGIRIQMGISKQNLVEMIGRTAASFTMLGLVLPAMTYGLTVVNSFIGYLVNLSHHNMGAAMQFSQSLSATFSNGAINLMVSIIFLALFAMYIFKVLLHCGRRWFDIMVAAIVSPLAFGALIFDSTSGFFKQWWANVVQLYLVQLVHAVYVSVLALIILNPSMTQNIGGGFTQILLIIGALWRLSTPPRFISSMSGGEDSRRMFRDIRKQISRFYGKGEKSTS